MIEDIIAQVYAEDKKCLSTIRRGVKSFLNVLLAALFHLEMDT